VGLGTAHLQGSSPQVTVTPLVTPRRRSLPPIGRGRRAWRVRRWLDAAGAGKKYAALDAKKEQRPSIKGVSISATNRAAVQTPARIHGYAPIRDCAAIGDGRTVALVARDGAIDWLPFPALDGPAVFSALLDQARGGRFLVEPEIPYEVQRRYLTATNVLETTFLTDHGVVSVTDAITLPVGPLGPFMELQRRIEGHSGSVPLRWRVEPRFGYGGGELRAGRRAGVPVFESGPDAVAVCAYDAGEVESRTDDGIEARLVVREGMRGVIALCFAHEEPLVLPARNELDARFEETCAIWRGWAEGRSYSGPWKEAVLRSALALKLLVHAPSGAVAAAATTSLPEELGGERNWDYRFCWIRDSAFTLDAFLQLGCPAEARAYFWWLMHASQLTHPRLRVLYTLNGADRAPEQELSLEGYRGSRPVRVGNGAAEQLQLDTYGELMQTSWLYAGAGNRIDPDIARRLAGIADFVCDVWREPDSGIWEVRSEPVHFTQSKMMCWVALERAVDLARRGVIADDHAPAWEVEAEAIRDFIESECWSPAKQSYVRFAGSEETDASLLLGLLHGFEGRAERLSGTVEAIRRELSDGPYVHRYRGEDGLAGTEGAFLSCSFWLTEALARGGRVDEAAELMDQLVALANDVGLYGEEIDPATNEFLGNTPQALSHLALISAAVAIDEEASR
jgi:GH15 family glucan-1,4-alpha-glucosidase